jgi:hypothetical protein
MSITFEVSKIRLPKELGERYLERVKRRLYDKGYRDFSLKSTRELEPNDTGENEQLSFPVDVLVETIEETVSEDLAHYLARLESQRKISNRRQEKIRALLNQEAQKRAKELGGK